MKIVHELSKTIVIVVIAVIGFLVFTFFPVHFDFSKNSAYTLSPATKKTISSIDKLLTIQVFLSSDLPTKLLTLKTDVTELLQEYRRSGKNIQVKMLDPKGDTKVADQAKQYGIPQMQFSQLEQNKYQVSAAYFGIVLTYGDKTEVIPQVTDYTNLEYNLTSAIYRMTRTEMPSIALVGESSASQTDPFALLKQTLSQQYTVSSVDLKTIKPEDEAAFLTKYKTMIVLDPEPQSYTTEQIQLLKKFYEAGGNVLVFSGGTSIDEQTLSAQASSNNINELTATYGAQINSDFVLSTSAEYVNFGNSQGQFLAAYPFWIRSSIFDDKSGLFANLQYVSFPWTSSLSLTKKDSFQVSPLILSSDRSWIQKGTFTLSPDSLPQPKMSELQARVLGALIKNSKGGEMVVVASSRFPNEKYIGQGSGNLDFILNTVDMFSSGGALSGIRSRSTSSYPISDLSDSQKDVYKYAAILLFPLLWGIYGGIRLLRRK